MARGYNRGIFYVNMIEFDRKDLEGIAERGSIVKVPKKHEIVREISYQDWKERFEDYDKVLKVPFSFFNKRMVIESLGF